MELELLDACRPGPLDRLLEERAADAAAAMSGRDHQPEIGDVPARGVDVTREREPSDDLLPVLRDVDGGVRMAPHRAQVSPLLRHAAPLGSGQQPRTLLAADLGRKLNERLRVGRFGGSDHDHGTTTP